MKWSRVIALTVLSVFLAAIASAQAPSITSYEQLVFPAGAVTATAAPVWSHVYPAAQVTCNVDAPAIPPTVVNPTKWFITDVAHAGKVCLGTIDASLYALPGGQGYQSVLNATDTLGRTSTPRSAASNPFDLLPPPAVPTGHKVTQ